MSLGGHTESLLHAWQAYIEFEISEGEHDRTRELYERLLDRTKHLKVWVSYAKFEATVPLEEITEEEDEIAQRKQRLLRSRGMLHKHEILWVYKWWFWVIFVNFPY
jgi:hypothetical protein